MAQRIFDHIDNRTTDRNDASWREPVIQLAGFDTKHGASRLHAVCSITETGQRVLKGQADFVELNGIDLWLGGVHLRADNL